MPHCCEYGVTQGSLSPTKPKSDLDYTISLIAAFLMHYVIDLEIRANGVDAAENWHVRKLEFVDHRLKRK